MDDLRGLIEDFEAKKAKIDLSPMMAFVDSTTGSNLQKGYRPPMSQEDRDAIARKLKVGAIQQQAKSEQSEQERLLREQLNAASQARLFAKDQDTKEYREAMIGSRQDKIISDEMKAKENAALRLKLKAMGLKNKADGISPDKFNIELSRIVKPEMFTPDAGSVALNIPATDVATYDRDSSIVRKYEQVMLTSVRNLAEQILGGGANGLTVNQAAEKALLKNKKAVALVREYQSTLDDPESIDFEKVYKMFLNADVEPSVPTGTTSPTTTNINSVQAPLR